MKEIEDLRKLSKKFYRIALFMIIPLWIELIMIFLKYNSPGQLFQNEYGINGMTLYLGLIFFLMFYFGIQSSKIESVANKLELKRNIKKNKKNKKTERTKAVCKNG